MDDECECETCESIPTPLELITALDQKVQELYRHINVVKISAMALDVMESTCAFKESDLIRLQNHLKDVSTQLYVGDKTES